ncbi:hypothetical protein [Micromonospora sp. LOL_015]|uniref:hypothetical protein n=1 Tax=Micromonospora sp. LOL_015 TaxID=3345416 RepID=UPI003A87EB75
MLLEYADFGLADGHLGLGYDLALQCVDRSRWTPEQLDRLRGGRHLLPDAADEFFTARRLRDGDRLEQGFSVLVG